MAIRRRRILAQLPISCTRGRAAVGERAARVVCGQRGRNITVIVAISDQVGVAYYEVGGAASRKVSSGNSSRAWVSSWETSRPPRRCDGQRAGAPQSRAGRQ